MLCACSEYRFWNSFGWNVHRGVGCREAGCHYCWLIVSKTGWACTKRTNSNFNAHHAVGAKKLVDETAMHAASSRGPCVTRCKGLTRCIAFKGAHTCMRVEVDNESSQGAGVSRTTRTAKGGVRKGLRNHAIKNARWRFRGASVALSCLDAPK